MRPSQRLPAQLREIQFHRHYTKYAEGSVLTCFGETKVLCSANLIEGVPRFMKGSGQGWLTAEYSMLPSATTQRTDREAVRGKQSGRTLEIQRLIGRALRHCLHLKAIGENTLVIDCDVIQADGGTRTAAITGACIALYDAMAAFQQKSKLLSSPFKQFIAAVSVGMYQETPVLDLDYAEDSSAETDMNIVMDQNSNLIEIQGTAEKSAFQKKQLETMLTLAEAGIHTLIQKQRSTVNLS